MFNKETIVKEQTTIILELTPREAAVVQEMALMYNWERGEYRDEVQGIFRALDDVRHEFNQHKTVTMTSFGEAETGLWWIEETDDEYPHHRLIDE